MKLSRVIFAILLSSIALSVISCAQHLESQSGAKQVQPQSLVTSTPAVPISITAHVDLSTPEMTLKSFMSSMERGDMLSAIACVDGAKTSPFADILHRAFTSNRTQWSAADIHSNIQGDSATLTYSFIMRTQASGNEVASPDDTVTTLDKISLKREGEDWKIIPRDVRDMQFPNIPSESASLYATLLIYPTFAEDSPIGQSFKIAAEKADASKTATNAKQVSVALLAYVFDHKDTFPQSSTSYRTALSKYVVDNSIFVCPSSGDVFSLNKALAGKRYESISDVHNTVMLYEGENGHLDYHHYGNAMVAFADGSCRLVSREKAVDLIWVP